jgi:hypothetical protein
MMFRRNRLVAARARVDAGSVVPGKEDVLRATLADPRSGRWLAEIRAEMLRLGAKDTRP